MSDDVSPTQLFWRRYLGTTRRKVIAAFVALGALVGPAFYDASNKILSRMIQSNFKSITGIDPDQELPILSRRGGPSNKAPETTGSIAGPGASQATPPAPPPSSVPQKGPKPQPRQAKAPPLPPEPTLMEKLFPLWFVFFPKKVLAATRTRCC